MSQAHRPAYERRGGSERVTRYDYNLGPMLFIGQQILRAMQDAGHNPKIFDHYRSPEDQAEKKDNGVSRAGPFESAHQYYEAVDIAHREWAWFASEKAPDGAQFWSDLAACVKIVAERFDVELVHGHDWGWDSAHVELADWRTVRHMIGHRVPTQAELDARFQQVLPKVWKAHQAALLKRGQYEREPAFVRRLRARLGLS